MLESLTLPGSFPFAVALVLLLLLAVLECVGLLLGFGLAQALEKLLAGFGLDIGLPGVGEPQGVPSRFLTWLQLGEVPALVLFIVFLAAFGLIGLFIQACSLRFLGFGLPGWVAALVVLPVSLPPVRWFGRGLARILPRDETQVVFRDSFVGRVAVITLGTAQAGLPAQARLCDRHGQTHYVMVEPHAGGPLLEQGQSVLLVEQRGAIFVAIGEVHPALEDRPD